MTSSIQLKDGIANTVANDQPQGMIIKIRRRGSRTFTE